MRSTIARKPDHKLQAMLQVVDDTKHISTASHGDRLAVALAIVDCRRARLVQPLVDQ